MCVRHIRHIRHVRHVHRARSLVLHQDCFCCCYYCHASHTTSKAIPDWKSQVRVNFWFTVTFYCMRKTSVHLTCVHAQLLTSISVANLQPPPQATAHLSMQPKYISHFLPLKMHRLSRFLAHFPQ